MTSIQRSQLLAAAPADRLQGHPGTVKDGISMRDKSGCDDKLLLFAVELPLCDHKGEPVDAFSDGFDVVHRGYERIWNDRRFDYKRRKCTAHFPLPSPLFPNPGERLNQFGTKSSQNLTNGKWRTNTTRRKTVIQLVRVAGYSSISTEQVRGSA